MENEMILPEKMSPIIVSNFGAAKTKNNAIVFTIGFLSPIFAGIVTMLMSAYLPVTVQAWSL
jgi:hypothetical protein